MNSRQAKNSDLEQVMKLLNSCGLPSDDCSEHINNFIVSEDSHGVVAAGGLEIYGAVALLRSVAVLSEYRNQGVAKCICLLLEQQARKQGVTTLYLLTENAMPYFYELGFMIHERSKTPVSIQNTKQFRELCPTSATVMFRDIREVMASN